MSETMRHKSWKTQKSELKGSEYRQISFTWWSRINKDIIVEIRE